MTVYSSSISYKLIYYHVRRQRLKVAKADAFETDMNKLLILDKFKNFIDG